MRYERSGSRADEWGRTQSSVSSVSGAQGRASGSEPISVSQSGFSQFGEAAAVHLSSAVAAAVSVSGASSQAGATKSKSEVSTRPSVAPSNPGAAAAPVTPRKKKKKAPQPATPVDATSGCRFRGCQCIFSREEVMELAIEVHGGMIRPAQALLLKCPVEDCQHQVAMHRSTFLRPAAAARSAPH
jgi:hypothetical protein